MIRKLNVISNLTTVAFILALTACSGSQEKAEEPTGSLIRTYTLIDEDGRKSGTLKVDPFGSVELYDADGKLIRKHDNVPPGKQPAATPVETQPAVAPAKTQPKADPNETQTTVADPKGAQTTAPTGQ